MARKTGRICRLLTGVKVAAVPAVWNLHVSSVLLGSFDMPGGGWLSATMYGGRNSTYKSNR
jgi:hypothetical protein